MLFGPSLVPLTAAALLAGYVAAQQPFEENKYPNMAGQWLRVGPLGVFDSAKPVGRGQQAPLTPEYQEILRQSRRGRAGRVGRRPRP